MVLTGGEDRRHRSISQLKSFTRCGEAFYLERFKKDEIQKRPAVWTLLGLAAHDAITIWERSNRNVGLAESFTTCYDDLSADWLSRYDRGLWILPPRTKDLSRGMANYRTRGLEILQKYEQYCLTAAWEVTSIEREFEVEVGDSITIRGAVDRILYFPATDEFCVEDLKSGNISGEFDVRQLGLYAYVARTEWGIPVTEGRYYFLKAGRPSAFVNLEKYDKNFWAQTFTRLDSSINQGLFLSNPGDICTLCSVKPWCSTQGWLNLGEKL